MLKGDLIGVHYHDKTQANAVVSYATDKAMPLCCGLTREDLSVIHMSATFDNELKFGAEVNGVKSGERRALAIHAVFTNGMHIVLTHSSPPHGRDINPVLLLVHRKESQPIVKCLHCYDMSCLF